MNFWHTYDTEITFIICAMFGGVMHYLKKNMKGETDATLVEWYGKNNLPATIYTITVFFFAIIGALAADVVNEKTGFFAAMYSGFATGFSIDAGFNGDVRQMTKDLIDNKQDLNTFFQKNSQSSPTQTTVTQPVNNVQQKAIDLSGAPVEGATTNTTPQRPTVTKYRLKK